MYGNASAKKDDFKMRSLEIRRLVHEINGLNLKEINEIRIEKGFGDFIIRIESNRFTSYRPSAGMIKIKVTTAEFWARHGPAHAALKDKILDGLKAL